MDAHAEPCCAPRNEATVPPPSFEPAPQLGWTEIAADALVESQGEVDDIEAALTFIASQRGLSRAGVTVNATPATSASDETRPQEYSRRTGQTPPPHATHTRSLSPKPIRVSTSSSLTARLSASSEATTGSDGQVTRDVASDVASLSDELNANTNTNPNADTDADTDTNTNTNTNTAAEDRGALHFLMDKLGGIPGLSLVALDAACTAVCALDPSCSCHAFPDCNPHPSCGT